MAPVGGSGEVGTVDGVGKSWLATGSLDKLSAATPVLGSAGETCWSVSWSGLKWLNFAGDALADSGRVCATAPPPIWLNFRLRYDVNFFEIFLSSPLVPVLS